MKISRFIKTFKPALWGFVFCLLIPNKIVAFLLLFGIYLFKEYVESKKEDASSHIGKVWRWLNEGERKE